MGYPIATNLQSQTSPMAENHHGRVAGTQARWGVIPDWVWSAQGRPGSNVSPLRLAQVLEDVGGRLDFQQIRSRLMSDAVSSPDDRRDGGARGA